MRYCHRPFTSVGDMDAALLENTNSRVGRGDLLYFLGDWSFKFAAKYRKLINCPNIHFIRGNHDRESDKVYRELFTTVKDLNKIKTTLDGKRVEIVLCHYAMRVWNKSHHGVWHLYAHSHNTLPDNSSLSLDVGVDAIAGRATGKTYQELKSEDAWTLLDPEQYRPTSLEEVCAIMNTKQLKTVDHHGTS